MRGRDMVLAPSPRPTKRAEVHRRAARAPGTQLSDVDNAIAENRPPQHPSSTPERRRVSEQHPDAASCRAHRLRAGRHPRPAHGALRSSTIRELRRRGRSASSCAGRRRDRQQRISMTAYGEQAARMCASTVRRSSFCPSFSGRPYEYRGDAAGQVSVLQGHHRCCGGVAGIAGRLSPRHGHLQEALLTTRTPLARTAPRSWLTKSPSTACALVSQRAFAAASSRSNCV